MEYKFHCPHCGQRISASTELIGTAASCPTCNQGFVVPHEALPLAAKPKAFRHWFNRAIYAVGILAIFLALSFAISESGKSKQRTIAAWRRMQEINTQMLTSRGNDLQQAFLQHSFLLSQIDLDSVDSALVEHLRATINVYRSGADLVTRQDSDLMTAKTELAKAQQFVGQLSNLTDTPQQAAGVDLLGGLLLQGGAGEIQQSIKRKYETEKAAQFKAHDENERREKELADQLTKKYGVPFITAM